MIVVRSFIIIYIKTSQNKNNIKLCSRNSSYGAGFAERFNRTIRDLLKKIVFEKGHANWIDVLPKITKQYKNIIHNSTTTRKMLR